MPSTASAHTKNEQSNNEDEKNTRKNKVSSSSLANTVEIEEWFEDIIQNSETGAIMGIIRYKIPSPAEQRKQDDADRASIRRYPRSGYYPETKKRYEDRMRKIVEYYTLLFSTHPPSPDLSPDEKASYITWSIAQDIIHADPEATPGKAVILQEGGQDRFAYVPL